MTTMHHAPLSADDQAAIIARLTASYGRPTVVSAEGPVTTALKAAKAAKVGPTATKVDDGSQAAPVVRQLITTAAMPLQGSLDPKGYLVAMRRASTREQRIAAIAGFLGFDTRGDYSSQELAANMQAHRELRGAVRPLPRPVHTASVTVAGFIAGMPDQAAKRQANLEAQDRATVEAIIACEAAGDETMAAVERDRLKSIRTDLGSL